MPLCLFHLGHCGLAHVPALVTDTCARGEAKPLTLQPRPVPRRKSLSALKGAQSHGNRSGAPAPRAAQSLTHQDPRLVSPKDQCLSEAARTSQSPCFQCRALSAVAQRGEVWARLCSSFSGPVWTWNSPSWSLSWSLLPLICTNVHDLAPCLY